jgi:lipoyl(octanoyl) transferase
MDAYCYLDQPRSGAMNMAIDDALLDRSAERREALLRIYTWAVPTLSLGYFQRVSERENHAESRDLAMVRRATGGGAIVHHHELTYSLSIPQEPTTLGPATEIYRIVHGAIVTWLKEMGLQAEQWHDSYCLSGSKPLGPESLKCNFLCFHRRSVGDIVVGQHKVLGSAQRRNKGALLQHGSLLLATSRYAPSLVGLGQMTSVLPSDLNSTLESPLARLFCDRIASTTGVALGRPFKYEQDIAAVAEESCGVYLAKYQSNEWLYPDRHAK